MNSAKANLFAVLLLVGAAAAYLFSSPKLSVWEGQQQTSHSTIGSVGATPVVANFQKTYVTTDLDKETLPALIGIHQEKTINEYVVKNAYTIVDVKTGLIHPVFGLIGASTVRAENLNKYPVRLEKKLPAMIPVFPNAAAAEAEIVKIKRLDPKKSLKSTLLPNNWQSILHPTEIKGMFHFFKPK